MASTFEQLQALVAAGRFRVSDHGDEELADDRISTREAVAGLASAEVIESYPDTGRGPSVLTLQAGEDGRPIHLVWALAYNGRTAVLVTAYRPDPERWQPGWRTRRT